MFNLFNRKRAKREEMRQLRERIRRTKELENDTRAKANIKERRIRELKEDIRNIDKRLGILYAYQTDNFYDMTNVMNIQAQIDTLEKEKQRLEDMLEKMMKY